MILDAAMRAGAAMLAEAGTPDAPREARLLMRWALGVDGAALSAMRSEPLPPEARARFEAGIARRARREPLSHITGRREFWGRSFIVTPDVLDPRPETETLVSWALEGSSPARILDLGVGSGCILLSLLAERPDAQGLGVDASEEALSVARANAASLGLSARVRFLRSDWLERVEGAFDLILANPPYLRLDEMATLSPEVAREPAAALVAGVDGLDAYRAISAGLPRALAPEGAALFEIGAGQEGAVAAILRAALPENEFGPVEMRQDLDGRVRTLRILRKTGAATGF